MVQKIQELSVFDKAHKFALKIYKFSSQFPKSELYGITSQIRRAATSVPANIVEGNSRKSKKEFVQFLFTAKASLIEVNYFLLLSRDLEFIGNDIYERLIVESDEIGKMISGLLNYLSRI